MVKDPSWAVKAPAMVTGPAKVEVPVPETVRFPPIEVLPPIVASEERVAAPETEKVPFETARFPEETVKPFRAEASVRVSIFWDWFTMVMEDRAEDWAWLAFSATERRVLARLRILVSSCSLPDSREERRERSWGSWATVTPTLDARSERVGG